MPELLTAEEVAAALRVSLDSVRRYARTGVLPAVKITPKTIRYRREGVAKLLGA